MTLKNSRSKSNASFLDACNLRQPAHTPVWFMRQAGRYLPSYKKVKGTMPVTQLAKDPSSRLRWWWTRSTRSGSTLG